MSFIEAVRARVASRDRASGLFLCHAPCERVLAHYERLRAESAGLVDWTLVIDRGHLDAPRGEAGRVHPGIVMPRRFAAARAIGRLTEGAGMMDTVIMPRVLAAPHEFVWALEFDVDYSGRWSEMFGRFAGNRADVLTTTLVPRACCPDWHHWSVSRTPEDVGAANWFRSFNPILRLSRRFAAAYVAAMESAGWDGHYEFTIPTIARHLGFRIEDLARPCHGVPGAMFSRALAKRAGAKGTGAKRAGPPLYDNTPADRYLGPGSFIFRPARPAYFHERPQDFAAPGRLYHPVKPA